MTARQASEHQFNHAMAMLERFEREPTLLPADAAELVSSILRACGHKVTDQGFIEGVGRVDCYFETNIEGASQRIGVEVKFQKQPVGASAVEQAFRIRDSGHFDRAMVISRSEFLPAALRRADTVGLGKIDLLSPLDLRNWLSKFSEPNLNDRNCSLIVRQAMRDVARRLATHPHELAGIEWRDLERLLRETFEGLGFDTTLTRSGKDGGFDLELATSEHGSRQTYLVEVKHWTDQKPGPAHLRKLISVTAAKGATGSLLLSTSGFATTIYSGLLELSAPVRLGVGSKVISLCRAYHRLSSGYWLEAPGFQETLFSETHALGEFPGAHP